MNDPRHPPAFKPMPQPAKSGGLMDPLVATSHEQSGPGHAPAAHAPKDKVRIDDDPIELVADEAAAPGPGGSTAGGKMSDSFAAKRIIALGSDHQKLQENWKRQTIKTGTGACRVKSFHGKYSDEGMRYLDHSINTWLDAHPEVEVKFVTSTVNLFEGKIREPALVLNVWY